MNLHSFASTYRLRKPKADECGDLNIVGKRGDIYEFDGSRMAASIFDGRHRAYWWNKYRNAAKAMGLQITHNGDREGTFLFNPEHSVEAEFAIEAIRAPRKRKVAPEHREKLVQVLIKARSFRRKTQSEAPDDAQQG